MVDNIETPPLGSEIDIEISSLLTSDIVKAYSFGTRDDAGRLEVMLAGQNKVFHSGGRPWKYRSEGTSMWRIK